MAPIYAKRSEAPGRLADPLAAERARRPPRRMRSLLRGLCVLDALLGEARLGRAGELLLGRLRVARRHRVALALLHEARLGSAGELLFRRHAGTAARWSGH